MKPDCSAIGPVLAGIALDDLRGSTEPRLWTQPLRELTPETSYGFAVVDFARDTLKMPLDPWEQWTVIHAGELLEDGRPRFRTVLTIVARQNGKTFLCAVLALFWLFVEKHPMILGTAHRLNYAKEAWMKAVFIAEDTPALAGDIHAILRGNNDVRLTTFARHSYKIAAANAGGGRSLTIDRLIQDELREQKTRDAWDAAVPAMSARPFAQNWCISNAGTDASIVLNDLRDQALLGVNPRLGIFEYSAPETSDPIDPAAWCAANPNLGYRISAEDMYNDARQAKSSGGLALAGFLTERLCIRVRSMNTGVEAAAWHRGASVGTLDGFRSRLAVCVDVAPDSQHASLCAAAVISPGMVRVELVAEWGGYDCLKQLRNALPDLLATIKPRTVGWFPNGPAAALTADLKSPRDGRRNGWPPAGVNVEEIRAETPAVCMSFAEQVNIGAVVHSGQALLDLHVLAAEKLYSGSRWVFSRKGGGYVDGAYSAAGAVHLARTLPAAKSTRMPDLDFSVL